MRYELLVKKEGTNYNNKRSEYFLPSNLILIKKIAVNVSHHYPEIAEDSVDAGRKPGNSVEAEEITEETNDTIP